MLIKIIINASVSLAILFVSSTLHAKTEDWYTYWSLGISINFYPSDLENHLTESRNAGADFDEFSADMFGLYFPKSKNRLFGVVISDASNRVTYTNGKKLLINTMLYGVSWMQFVGDEPGDGYFLRGDLGVAHYSAVSNGENEALDTVTHLGHGFLAGFGYGFAMSEEWRILLGANYSRRYFHGERFSAMIMTLGVLW